MIARSLWPATGATIVAVVMGSFALVRAEEVAPLLPSQEQQAGAASSSARFEAGPHDMDVAIERLLSEMTLAEKIGQMCQVAPEGKELTPALGEALRAGEIGSIINAPDRQFAAEAQRIAREESRLGIPLLIGRDVIHGYRAIFPIPLGQAASWDPELVERAANAAAGEARSQGINWTFAPMVDICRDGRWGRIAETLGEDPLLAGQLAAAMVRGFQQEEEGRLQGVVACAKHFAAYGLSEGGRDYNRVSVSGADLHNVYLPPFRAAIDAGCRTLMTTFSEVNGVPGTAHEYLLRDVLRRRWKFPGFVVSDWNSVLEMIAHGYSADAVQAAQQAVHAGVDMEMASITFRTNLAALVEKGAISQAAIDDAVRRILRVKLQLLPLSESAASRNALMRPRSLEVARRLARESLVLLKNEGDVLPLKIDSIQRIAVVGALADDPKSQLGCWAPDGDAEDTVTPLEALRDALGESVEVLHACGASADFSTDASGLADAQQVAAQADMVLAFVGEDALLSGEARSRANLDLPGVQRELLKAVAESGKPIVMVVLAGRPLTIGAECDLADAVLYAWHPGTMGGPAIADVLLGVASPSGKLPATFLKTVGQTPLYYGHSNTGRPSPDDYRPLVQTDEKDLPEEMQYRSHYLDSDPLPLFPFGFGLSYTTFGYDGLELSTAVVKPRQTLGVRVRLTNMGQRAGTEVVQLYVRDVVARLVRPVRELKAFRRVHLRAGESKVVEFALDADDLAYFDAKGERVLKPGRFALWVGGDSTAELGAEFELLDKQQRPAASVATKR